MDKKEYLEIKYIKTKNKVRKITTYKEGENLLRKKHEDVVQFLKGNCKESVFSKAYVEHSSIVKNARAHMYNDVFVFFDVKNFFPNINHNYLAKQLYKELSRKNTVSLNSCSRLVELCSVGDKGLPLGLTTSPILSNIYMKEFDNIMYGQLKKLNLENVIYTRYADDIVVSYKGQCDCLEAVEKIRILVHKRLKKIGLKSNDKKERVFFIQKGGHVRITGINITRDNDNFRRLSVGRKQKDELYNTAVKYMINGVSDQREALKIKGYEAFVLSVEGKNYEECYSEKMIELLKTLGYETLHELIGDIKY